MRIAIAALALVLATSALAGTAEVAPGVHVTKKSFQAPVNEQPFFGFVDKAASMKDADRKFVAEIVQAAGSKERAFDAAIKRGWVALRSGDLVNAGRRFNQAWLIAPEQSGVYHGFAALAHQRFGDVDYAEELFRVALKQPNPDKTLRADFGRLLMIAHRPAEARPLLEQAVVDVPDFDTAWSNLGFARLMTGDAKGACEAAAEARKHLRADNVKADIALLTREAKC
jgi:Tfp pilus assembly protein PilF